MILVLENESEILGVYMHELNPNWINLSAQLNARGKWWKKR